MNQAAFPAVADAARLLDDAAEKAVRAREAVGKVVFGQDDVVESALVTILSGGHGLVVGVPGLAKTRLVEAIGTVLGLDGRRIQFTPDLMPSDIVGSEVLEEGADGRRHFRFISGPVFGQLLMADEINRASPRTQSALLQAMQERHVTVAGVRHDLPRPFHVLATQNPVEQEGTYPLPEAQLDRFLMQIDVDYPDEATERQILVETTRGRQPSPAQVLEAGELCDLQDLVLRMPVGQSVLDAIVKLVRSARGTAGEPGVSEFLDWGPGPRAGQALMLATRARALLRGRFAPCVDDVFALAEPVLQHRMALNFHGFGEGETVRGIIKRLVSRIA